tara:strand:- start:890 stop:1333 length:444 start_codon:yes stop_codon:yes gene_type:complete
MKETYIKIYNQAKQMVGLAAVDDATAAAINEQAQNLSREAGEFLGAPDGNKDAPTYVPPAGNLLGYACSTVNHGPAMMEGAMMEAVPEGAEEVTAFEEGEGPGGHAANAYITDPWTYPIDVASGNFVFPDPNNKSFNPCGGPPGGFA